MRLKEKISIITGAASGFGKGIAEKFSKEGAKLILADINKDLLEKVSKDLNQDFLHTDVANSNSMQQLADYVLKKYGTIDIMVNNAGITHLPKPLEEVSEDEFDKVFAVNVKGQFLCAKAAARIMLKQENGGVLINMSSESGLEGSEGQSVYAATKAANHNLTRSWAKELGTQGVRVIGVAPGIMETTGMRSESYEKSLAYTRGISVDELRTKSGSTSSIPLGRSGKLSEVADLVVFLASKRASYLHGTTVNISGGKSRG